MPGLLVAYYSRTGHTKRLAEAIAAASQATFDPILERHRRRGGFVGNMVTTFQALTGQTSEILPAGQDPRQYSLLAIGTQVWAGSLPPPVRAYVLANRERIGDYALFCTLGGMGSSRVFGQIAELLGRAPLETLAVRQGQLPSGAFLSKAVEFAAALKYRAAQR